MGSRPAALSDRLTVAGTVTIDNPTYCSGIATGLNELFDNTVPWVLKEEVISKLQEEMEHD